MTTYGLDSLTSMELRGHIESALKVTLAVTYAWTHPTVAALAVHLTDRLGLHDGTEDPNTTRTGGVPIHAEQ
jgi:hypothetical protein